MTVTSTNGRTGEHGQVSHPITPEGYERLSLELRHLKHTERHAISRAIEEARDHGDLKENAEYHAAKDRQGMVEARIRQLEGVLGEAQIIDPRRRPTDKVAFGAHVTVVDVDTEVEASYRIVGEHEVDPDQGLISIRSPLARALMGRKSGDDITFTTPGGEREIEITAISY